MLSYRHGYHAGNHADVLKHIVLIKCLRYMAQKDKAFWVIDAHAGAGMYALDEGFATKLEEYRTGIGRLWERQDIPAGLGDYMGLVRAANRSGVLRQYPGSPWLALQCLREQDRLRLFELHANESRVLADRLQRAANGQVIITAGEGLAGLKSLLPPQTRRAFALIDPSYEIREDYEAVVASLQDSLKRFATGTYALWYPQLSRRESLRLPDQLKALGADNWLNVSLAVRRPTPEGIGMYGSGMFIINPPWTLAAELATLLPWLVDALGETGKTQNDANHEASFVLESQAR